MDAASERVDSHTLELSAMRRENQEARRALRSIRREMEDLKMSFRLLSDRVGASVPAPVVDLVEEEGPVAGPSTVRGNEENEVAVPVPGPFLLPIDPAYLLVPVEEVEDSDDEGTVVVDQVARV